MRFFDSPRLRGFTPISGERKTVEAFIEQLYLLNRATTIEQLAEEAMMLPTESRARLADMLVESLDAADLTQLDQLWLAEAKRRRDEVRTGDTETISGEEALRSVRDSLSR